MKYAKGQTCKLNEWNGGGGACGDLEMNPPPQAEEGRVSKLQLILAKRHFSALPHPSLPPMLTWQSPAPLYTCTQAAEPCCRKEHTSVPADFTLNPWLGTPGTFSHFSGSPTSYPLLPCQLSLLSSPLPLLLTPALLQLVTLPHLSSRPDLHPAKLAFRVSLSSGFLLCLANGRGRQETGGWKVVGNGSDEIPLLKDPPPAKQCFLHHLSHHVLTALLWVCRSGAESGSRLLWAPGCFVIPGQFSLTLCP